MAGTTLTRSLRRIVEKLGVRSVPLAGLVAAAAGIIALEHTRARNFVASGVTVAPETHHGSEIAGTVERVHVAPGTHVTPGQVLASLHSLELDAERAELDAEIQRTVHAGVLAQLQTSQNGREAALSALARLSQAERDRERAQAERELQANLAADAKGYLARVEELARSGVIEQRAVWTQEQLASRQASLENQAGALLEAETARSEALRKEVRGNVPSRALIEATARFYETELDVLKRRRENLDKLLAHLTVKARVPGVVTVVVAEGTTIQPGDSIATVVPARAAEVVAYAPPDITPPTLGANVAYSIVLADGRHCDGVGSPRSSGLVEQKPGQLVSFSSLASYGFPIHVSLPAECRLPVGQVVEFQAKL
jgi:multidrug resistance efflux pump